MNTEPPSGRSGMIGPYRPVTTIGVGGMGQVLKVEDTRTGRYLALKIHYSPTDKEAVELSYRREHRALAKCDHPNVARTYGHGVHEGCPYLVMEYVDGVSLTEFLEGRDLSPGPERDKMAALLGIQIGSALEHIHHRNLVHLDLKPANILVTPDETVKLIDFGIARDMVRDEQAKNADIIGTYAFCSPEQVSGVPCDHRSDLYSLGVVLYLLLTDHLPFVAEQAIAYILKHVNQPPEPLETYYPDIPAPLAGIVLKLLEKKPLDRPQSGREVGRVLKTFVDSLSEGDDIAATVVAKALPESPPEARLLEPSFIGRANERRQLEASLALLEAGVGGLDIILGEIGQGKGRLMDQVLAIARARGIAVFTARCMPDAVLPYQGLQEILEQIVSYLISKEMNFIQVELGSHLPILARAFPSVSALLPARAPQVPDAAPQVEVERLQDALKAFLDAVLPGPAILALRELQWADQATMNLVSTVALLEPDPKRYPALWIGTVALESLADEHVITGWREEPTVLVNTISISPLNLDEVTELINSMLGSRMDLGSLTRVLHRETQGNPLFVAEAIRMMVERGDISPQGYVDDEVAGWNILIADEKDLTDDLARSFRETLDERVAMLPEPTQRILETIAVLGRAASYPWLRLMNPVTEDELLDMLDDVLTRHILVEEKGRRHNLFWFYHPNMAEVIRARVPQERLKTFHKEVARAYRKIHGDSDLASLEVVASHLFAGEVYEHAAAYLLQAAEARLRLGLHDRAMELLEQTLDCCRRHSEHDPRIAVAAHLNLGRVLHHKSNPERALGHLRTAATQAAEMEFHDLQGEAISTLAQISCDQGDYAASRTQFTEALAAHRKARDTARVLQTLNSLAESLWFLGDLPRTRKLLGEALIGAKKMGDSGLSSYAVNGLGLVAQHEGKLTQAAKHFAEAAGLSRMWGRDLFYLLCQRNEADVRLMMGDLVPARELAEKSAARLDQLGEQRDIASVRNVQAAIAIEMRDIEEAERYLEQSAKLLQFVPNHYGRAVRRLHHGRLEQVNGRALEAQMALGEVLDVAESRQYRELAARAQRYMGSALILAGALRDGLRVIRRAITSAEKLGNHPGLLEARLLYAEGLLVLGDREESLTVLSNLKVPLKTVGLKLLLIRALALLAKTANDVRRSNVARAHLDEALKLIREVTLPMNQEERQRFGTRPELRLIAALTASLPSQP